MLAIHGIQLKKTYGHYQVLQEVNLSIAMGECFALFGPNGSGKTTLLRILATLYRPTEGRFEIMGRDGMKDKEAVRSDLMLFAHGSHLYDDLNAIENLRFALALRNITPTERDIKSALDQVAIGAFADMKTRNYSAGMKKRLGLAKAILAQPKVLLLDEPFTALDDAGVTLMQTFIHDTVDRGGAVLLSTHDREKVTTLAHRAGILSHGMLQPTTVSA